MWLSVKWLVLWSLWAARLIPQRTPPLRVTSGWLRGAISPSGSHASYLGIPYATITHKFQAPGPEPTWDGVFDAVNEHVICRQGISHYSKYTVGQEDCLVVNVHAPLNIPQNKPLPVMVYIHGGGFFEHSGTPSIYGVDYLVKKGVVIVTFNYRLNIQGFLCLGIKEAPGNAGLKDQVAALKWVQNNIRAFGGDPDDVTLFGESAGGASVSYHVLSPMSKGLFHKAITQSGSSLSSWALDYNPIQTASTLAKALGFDSENPREIYDFFMNTDDIDLTVTRIPREEGNMVVSEIIYVPCAEKKVEGVEHFFTELPYDVLSRGNYSKVPMMIGFNAEEGLFFVNLEKKIDKITLHKALPRNLEFPNKAERIKVANHLAKIYMGDDKINASTGVKLSRYFGETYLIYDIVEETALRARTSDKPVYHFTFAYDGWRNVIKWLLPSHLSSVKGATHTDDIFHLFSQYLIPSLFEHRIIEVMTTMWTNFAKYGDPTPAVSELLPIKWPAITADDQRGLVIDEQLSTKPLWFNDSLKALHDMYSKYRRKL